MKELKKMNFGELQKLSRAEMKKIMAGSGSGCVSCGCENYRCGGAGGGNLPCCDGYYCMLNQNNGGMFCYHL